VFVRVGEAVITCVAVELGRAVPVNTGGVVAARVDVAVNGGRVLVARLVEVIEGLAGGGVLVKNAGVRVEVGVVVPVGRDGGAGVRVWSEDTLVGVGVNRKTPVTTGSSLTTCPFSRRITSNTAGFMGATFS
jgi:hypothetical protein